jgi:hypothetical protein
MLRSAGDEAGPANLTVAHACPSRACAAAWSLCWTVHLGGPNCRSGSLVS